MGRGPGQLGEIGHEARPDLTEIVDAGHADVAHVAPEGAFAVDQRYHRFFVVQVDHVFHVPCVAPILLRLVEIFAEHGAPDVPVVGLGALRLGRHPAAEDQGDVGFQVVAFHRLKGFEQLGRPRGDARVVGFVTAEAEDGFAELVADRLFVGLVNEFDKRARRHGIEIVDQRVERVLGGATVVPIVVAGG